MLLQCRSERKLSLEAVGREVGMTGRQLANIELGLNSPRRVSRLRIEAFLRRHGYFPKSEAA